MKDKGAVIQSTSEIKSQIVMPTVWDSLQTPQWGRSQDRAMQLLEKEISRSHLRGYHRQSLMLTPS